MLHTRAPGFTTIVCRAALATILTLGFLAAPLVAEAQPAGKVWRIGFRGSGSASGQVNRMDALREGLRELGYTEGKNIVIESRWAEGKYDRLPDLAAELVRLRVDILVTSGTPGTLAAKRTTTTIPIVMAGSSDAVATGLVSSLARPGGNITGSTDSVPELMAKQLELLKGVLPRTQRVAVLVNPDNPSNAPVRKAMETTAASLKIQLQRFELRGAERVCKRFYKDAQESRRRHRGDHGFALQCQRQGDCGSCGKEPASAAGTKEFAEAGGLIGYGMNFPAMFSRAAYFVDKIFKGAKPADIPVEQPTKFELVINLKTATALGLTVPPSLLGRADQVIQ
jgi:putative ABC transport system substrate-binding protein